MTNIMKYKEYYGDVEFSDEDAVLHGRIIGINDRITYEGDSVAALRNGFMEAVDEYSAICVKLGKDAEKSIQAVLPRRV